MTNLARIQQQVQALTRDELARFRAWFLEYDQDAWDAEIEQDAAAGRLDALEQKARRDHAVGLTTPLSSTQ